MANEIKLGYYTGQTLTYAVYNPDGTEVTAPGTALPEIAATGYYTATNASIAAGDVCIVSDTNGVLFQGEYLPDVTASVVSAAIAAAVVKIDVIDGIVDTIDNNVDVLIVAQQTVNNNFPVKPEETGQKARIYI